MIDHPRRDCDVHLYHAVAHHRPPRRPRLRCRCAAVLQAAHQRGEIGLYGGPYPATFSGRDVYFNATRFPGDSTDPADWTQAEIQGRKDAWTMFNLWQAELPEFAESYFMTSGPTAGARESRRIVDDYVLTGDDVAEGRGALLVGGILTVVSDRRYVSFMYSYPNLIPLPAAKVEHIAAAVAPDDFDRIYGAWWDRVVACDGKEAVRRSAERYVRALLS